MPIRPYKYNLPKMADTRQLVDMRVKAGMTLEEISSIYKLPHIAYLSQYITKLGNEVPAFGGYDPLGKDEVIEWLSKKDLTMIQVADHFGITEKGLLAYCKMYRINLRKPNIDEIKSLREKGFTGKDLGAYYGVTAQHLYNMSSITQANAEELDGLDEVEKATKQKINALEKKIEALQLRLQKYKTKLEKIRAKKKKIKD